MSHFKLLVTGENIEEQLEPYSENLQVPEYEDKSEDVHSCIEDAKKHNASLPVEQQQTDMLQILRDYFYGDTIKVNAEGKYAKFTTYNPKSQWDWWVIGGRYNSSLLVYPGTNPDYYIPAKPHYSQSVEDIRPLAADSAIKRAIDFDTMKQRRLNDLQDEWDRMYFATVGIDPPAESFTALRDRLGDEVARREWNSHPWVTTMRENNIFDAYNYFHMDEQDPETAFFADAKAGIGFSCYAILHEGEWISREDEEYASMTVWLPKIIGFIKGLPGDTRLTVVDCHI